jgi:hypothetical protein
MAVKYSKRSINITIFSIPRHSKFYRNWDFWFENKPSGNPGFVDDDTVSLKNSFDGRRLKKIRSMFLDPPEASFLFGP